MGRLVRSPAAVTREQSAIRRAPTSALSSNSSADRVRRGVLCAAAAEAARSMLFA
jgi:hypothetical protein